MDASSVVITLVITLFTIIFLWLFAASVVPVGGGGCGMMGGGFGMMGGVNFIPLAILLNLANLFLLAYLISQYIVMYRTIKSEFTLGLIVLAYILLAHSILANPLLFPNMMSYGFMGGPLSFVPALLTTIGAAVLLYLNSR